MTNAIPKIIGRQNFFDAPDAAAKAAQGESEQKRRQLNADILATFSTAAGKRTFEWLWGGTVMQSTFHGSFDGAKAANYGFYRGGQNELMLELHRRMELAKKEERNG